MQIFFFLSLSYFSLSLFSTQTLAVHRVSFLKSRQILKNLFLLSIVRIWEKATTAERTSRTGDCRALKELRTLTQTHLNSFNVGGPTGLLNDRRKLIVQIGSPNSSPPNNSQRRYWFQLPKNIVTHLLLINTLLELKWPRGLITYLPVQQN